MKKRFLVRRGLLAGAIVAATGGMLAVGALPAGASNVQVTAAGSFTTYQVMHNIFGSSLNDLLPTGQTTKQQVKSTTSYCKYGMQFTVTATSRTEPTIKTPAINVVLLKNQIRITTGGTPTTITVPGLNRQYTTKVGAPNGSTAGKKELHNEEGWAATRKECITFARSSSAPNFKTVSTHFDYYAYALDGVGVLVGQNAGGSNESPVTLSLTQIKNIYLCKAGYTNWKTVLPTTGATAPIIRYWPQAGSGTRSVYTSMLGFTPDTITPSSPTHGSLCTSKPYTTLTTARGLTVGGTSKKVVEENSEEGILYVSHKLSLPVDDAIFIYSAGKFEQEWNTTTNFNSGHVNTITGTAIGNFTANTLRLAKMLSRTASPKGQAFVAFGSQSGTFNKTTNRGSFSINTTVVKESNEWFSHIKTSTTTHGTTSSAVVPGVRYIYNVADTSLPTYSEAKMMVGFDNRAGGAKSALCNGDDSAAIVATGFVPLNKGTSAIVNKGGTTATAKQTNDLAGAFCREFPGSSWPTWASGPKAWTASGYAQAT